METEVEDDKTERQDLETKKKKRITAGALGSWLNRYRGLAAGSLVVAVAIHILLLLGFGGYTIFKGSAPRMPFTSEDGVAADGQMDAPPPDTSEPDPAMEADATPMPTETPSLETDTVLALSTMTGPPTTMTATVPSLSPPSMVGTELEKPKSRSGAKASAVNFFGVKGEGTNVYFVVDLSDSMLETERGGVAGFAAVKSELKHMIQSLDEATLFNVVAYGASGADRFEPTSVPATPDKKKAAGIFIDRYNISSEKRGTLTNNYRPKISEFGVIQGDKDTGRITTRLDLGLLAAFEGLADTIFLISDGKPPVLAEDLRGGVKVELAGASVSEADRSKYQKEVEAWRIAYEKYTEEIKKYREKYKDLLAKRDAKILEAKQKGDGKVIEGVGVDYKVKISGIPSEPQAPPQPQVPQRKTSGNEIKTTGKVYDENELIKRIRDVYMGVYKKADAPIPSIHTVGYMSKPAETKFMQNLAARNNGTFKAIYAPIR